MRRLAAILPLLMLVAGCEGADSGPAPVASTSIRASFMPHGLVDVIQIDTVDPLALRTAELIAPDGSTTPSDSIDVSRSPRYSAGGYVANDAFRGGVGGSAIPGLLTPPSPLTASTLRAEGEILTTVSHASIPLPDPVAYRRDWRRYRVRLAFGFRANEVETREIPAPEPPAPQR
jgi:hypothetical protein